LVAMVRSPGMHLERFRHTTQLKGIEHTVNTRLVGLRMDDSDGDGSAWAVGKHWAVTTGLSLRPTIKPLHSIPSAIRIVIVM
jgi:hypothetical protein